jgi:ferric iron reductase protein FhuF
MLEEINKTTNNTAKDELTSLLRANLERSEEILKISQEIKSYIKWQNIWSILRFVIIVIPIVLGFIYLPPLIKDAFQSYRSLLGQ